MADDRALVGNAADKAQVETAKRKERDRRKQELADLRAVLALSEGRRTLWRMLEYCKAFQSVYHDIPGRMAKLAGEQDVGHHLMAEIEIADQDALFLMMRENKETTDA